MLGNRTVLRQLLILGLLCLLTRSALGQQPVSVTVLPNTVTAGAGSTGIVALTAPAARAVIIALTCNTSGVTVPASVTVGVGKQSAMFSLSTQASDQTAIVTLTARGGGSSAVGFFMVQAATAKSPTVPAFAGLTFSPTPAMSGQKITGTITFTAPLIVSLIFVLTSHSPNITVPAQVTVAAGMKSFPFQVTVSPQATMGTTQITATLAPGIYNNAWSGPLSISGNLTVGGTGLPPNYTVGFWVAPPVLLKAGSSGSFFVPTLKTYPDGHLFLSEANFGYSTGSTGTYYDYDDFGPYLISGHAGYNGQISLDSNPGNPGNNLFQENGGGSLNGSTLSIPSYLYDQSTLTFSSDGKTATLTVIAQEYTWTLTATPMIVFGNTVTLGTYTFTRVQ